MRLAVVILILSMLAIPTLALTITDSPPDLVLYTKTGERKVLITATARDDVEVTDLEIYVNDIPVFAVHKDGSKFEINYKHELKGISHEITRWLGTGTSPIEDWLLKHLPTEDHGKELSVENFSIVLTPGDYIIKTVARDSAGHTVEKIANVTIIRDYPPSITITAPSSVRTNTGTAKVDVSINASDDLGLKSVELFVDDKLLKTIDIGSKKSYSETVTLDITGAGKHEIKAVATDTGDEKVSDTAQVQLIKNQPPTVSIEKIENTTTATTQADVKFTISYSDDFTVTKVALYVDGNLVDEIKPDKANGSWVKVVTLSRGSHEVKAIATDDMGLQGEDVKSFSVTKDSPPSVEIISPKDGDVIWTTSETASVTIKAQASDDLGVSKVEFYLDGSLIETDTSAPYETTTSVSVGKHTIEARATDTSGQSNSSIVSIDVRRDNPPSVSITSPANGTVFWTTTDSYTITVKANATDDRGISRVEFYVDENLIGTDTSAPFEITTTLTTGMHTIKVVAVDTAKQTGEDSIAVTVIQDKPPSVEITNPTDGAVFWTTNSTHTVKIVALPIDDLGISKVTFYVDGNKISEDTTSPYEATAILTLGNHTIKAVAVDTAGQNGTDQITVTVKKDNPPSVEITNPKDGAVFVTANVTETVKITANATDDRGVDRVEFYANGKLLAVDTNAPYEAKIVLTPENYTIKAIAYDTAGQNASDTIHVSIIKDSPPTVSIVSPKEGETISTLETGTKNITINAVATDDIGISKVEFYLDSQKIGYLTSQPYTLSTTVLEGQHTVKAIAYDTRGQSSTDEVNFTVVVDNKPFVEIVYPEDGAVFNSTGDKYTLTVVANATDDKKISSVLFYLDGQVASTGKLKSIRTGKSNLYSAKLTVSLGYHTITAVAYDSAGQSNSSSVVINVVRDNPPRVIIYQPTEGQELKTKCDGLSCEDELNVSVKAIAVDDHGIENVTFILDGVQTIVDTDNPYQATFTVEIGNHTVKAIAYDNSGQSSEDVVNFTVVSGNQPPSVKILYPANGSDISTLSDSATINVTFTAWDDNGISSWDLYVDGKQPDRSYWDVLSQPKSKITISREITLSLGTHTIKAVVTDTTWKKAEDSVTITVEKVAVPLSPDVKKVRVPEINWSAPLPKGKVVVIGKG